MKPMFRREQRGDDAQRGAVDRGAADGRPVVVSQVVRKACALPRSERLVACRQAASLETRTSYHSMGIVMIPPQFGDDTPRTDTCIWSCISMYLGRIPQVVAYSVIHT